MKSRDVLEKFVKDGSNTSASWNKTPLALKLGVQYPIIQGALGGFSTQRLASIVSNFGGLGSFGAHGLAPDAIKTVIEQIREQTSKPFAMNLWVSMEDDRAFTSSREAFDRSLKPLAPLIKEFGGILPAFQPYAPIKFESQMRVIIDAKVPVFSFIFGIPPKEILEECRKQNIVTIGGATTPEEAIALDKAGVDAIVASGFEGGGHRGSFLRAAENSLYGTFSLVPQVADLVSVPVIAAGGIADARGIVAAFALGAQGVQMGTAFLGSEESGASKLHRETILQNKAGHTALTKGFTGRLARGVQNHLMDLMNDKEIETLPYPLQRLLVKNLTAYSEKAVRPELMQLWAGQSAPLSRHSDAKTFLKELVSELDNNMKERNL